MDQNELIRKITEEVLRKLQTPAGGPPAPVPAGTITPAAASVSALPVLSPVELARTIDHTLLRPEAPDAAFDKLCQEAIAHHFFSVCVNSCRVAYVARRLQGSDVKVCSVIGFPLGAMTSRSKAFETRDAVSEGAAEIDMVLNIGALRSRDYRLAEEDIRAVRRATRATTVLKVIIETVFLTQEEKVIACELAMKAGADFVKTSTGFSGGGATAEDIALMRRVVGPSKGVKASGGIRNTERALLMIGAGANRIGAAAGVAIVTGGQGQGGY